MPARILQIFERKHLIFLVLSVVLFGYLALLRGDTTRSDLAIGGVMVLALWGLTALRVYLAAGQARSSARTGTPDAR